MKKSCFQVDVCVTDVRILISQENSCDDDSVIELSALQVDMLCSWLQDAKKEILSIDTVNGDGHV